MPRELPQYASQLSIGSMPKVQYSSAQAEATTRASAQLSAIGEDMQKKADDIEELQTKTTFSENLNRIYHESPNDPAAIKTKVDGFLKEFIPGIKNSELQKKMSITSNLEAQPIIDKATENFGKILDAQHKTTQLRALAQNKINMGAAVQMVLNGKSPEEIQSGQKAVEHYGTEQIKILGSTNSKGFADFDPETIVKEEQGVATTVLDNMSVNQLNDALNPTPGYDSAKVLVQKHEGGLNVNDGNTGNPAIFGINKKWHETAFNEVKAIYDTGDKAKAQAAADAYLKKTFWDAYGLDSLKPEQQGIVYDGTVNHHPGFIKKLVAAARAGAKPSELISMRQQEYDRLAATGEYTKQDVASWYSRLADYRHLAVGEYKDMLPADVIEKYRKEGVARFKVQEEQANIGRVMEAGARDKEIFAKFKENKPGILQDIEDYRNKNAGDPKAQELAGYMRENALKLNKMGAGEQSQLYMELLGKVNNVVTQMNDDPDKVKIEDLVRLESELMIADVRGVDGMQAQIKRLSNPILDKAGKDLDTTGWYNFWSRNEHVPYHSGYKAIENYLDKQGKSDDAPTKARMVRDFVDSVEKLPDDIKASAADYKSAQSIIAQRVIAEEVGKGFSKIPPQSIKRLLANPELAPAFDEQFGSGMANKVLGKK